VFTVQLHQRPGGRGLEGEGEGEGGGGGGAVEDVAFSSCPWDQPLKG
jgi:hypothetical protein